MPEKVRREIKPAPDADVEITRKAAQITLARLDNYQDLWAETEQEGDKEFVRKTRKLWKEFAVHGVLGKDKKTGERTILNFTDLDGRCALGLLKLAGIDTRDTKYITRGTYAEGRINLDTGGRHGVVIEDGGKTAIFDHHTSELGEPTSATEITYKVLTSLGLLKKEAHLDRLVEFATHVDNATYPEESKYLDNYFDYSWVTLRGLQRFATFKKLSEFFKEGGDPEEPLRPRELAKLGLIYTMRGRRIDRSVKQREDVKTSWKRLEAMRRSGWIIGSPRYGKIVVDVGKGVPGGFEAARAYGCGVYMIWNAGKGLFLTTTGKPLPRDFLPQGKMVRETMWIKPRDDGTPFTVTLRDVLDRLTDGRFEPTGRLQAYLEWHEKARRESEGS